VISRWPLRAKAGQKGQGLAGFEPGRREEDPQKDPPRPLGEKRSRGGEPCVTCRKVLNLDGKDESP
jgi:hypothetical protein